jgi:hypothetical protein
VPEANPLIAWKARTKLRSGENGKSRFIWPTVKAVVIHAPSSKPCMDGAPRIGEAEGREAAAERGYDRSKQHGEHADERRMVMMGGACAARSAG